MEPLGPMVTVCFIKKKKKLFQSVLYHFVFLLAMYE